MRKTSKRTRFKETNLSFVPTKQQKNDLSRIVLNLIAQYGQQELARKCQVAQATLRRWADGNVLVLRTAGKKSSVDGLEMLARLSGFESWTTMLNKPTEKKETITTEPTPEPIRPATRSQHAPVNAHDLLLNILKSGLQPGTRIYKIECKQKHFIGYTKTTTSNQSTLAILCYECSSMAGIGEFVCSADGSVEDEPQPIQEPQPKPQKETPTTKAEHTPSNTMAAARQKALENRMAKVDVIREKILTIFEGYEKNKPQTPAKDLELIINSNPYKPKQEMDTAIIYQALWLAKECYGDAFVKELTLAWGFPETALRSRVESLWPWFSDQVKLKMPEFIIKATKRPNFWLEKRAEALTKSPSEVQVGPEAKIEPPISDPAPEPVQIRDIEAPDPNWRTLNKLHIVGGKG